MVALPPIPTQRENPAQARTAPMNTLAIFTADPTYIHLQIGMGHVPSALVTLAILGLAW